MISIVIPAFNEEDSIGRVIDDIHSTMKAVKDKYEIIVVDDCSIDKTAEIAKSRKVRLFRQPYNMGYGSSIKKGLQNAKGEWIVITDADGTYPVKDIPKLLKYRNAYDMIVGARTGKIVEIPITRRPAKFILSKLANYLSSNKIPDLNSGLRVFKKDIAMTFFNLFPNRFSFTITITMAFLSNGYAVKFIPINYYKRSGKSNIQKRDLVRFSTLLVRLIMYFKPLKIFIPASAFIFLVGVIIFSMI